MADDFIRREDAMKYLGKGLCVVDWLMLEEKIEHIPAADVVPVVRGRWIESYNKWTPTKKCSACNAHFTQMAAKVLSVGEQCSPVVLNFCPNCGAKMEG